MLTFNNLNIGTKIILGYVVLVVLQVVLTAVLLFSVYRLTSQFTFLVQHDQPVLSNIAELEKLVVDMETGERGYLITGKDEFLEPYNNGLTAFDKLIAQQKELVSDNPPQVQALDEINVLHKRWLEVAAKPEIEARREVNNNSLTMLDVSAMIQAGTGKAILDEMRGKFATFTEKEQTLNMARSDSASWLSNVTFMLGFVITLMSMVVGPFIGWGISRSITASTIAMTKAASRLALGDVKQELTITGQDEMGQMAAAFRQMMTYQQNMAAVASRLARGDVTVNITAQSEQDVLGKAFQQMILYQQKMAEIAKQVAQGDLTTNITPESNQDMLGNAFVQMLRFQQDITAQIREATSSLSSAAAEILSATMQQVSGANEQSAAITQTTATITEVKTVAEQSFDKAEAVAKASYRSNEISQNGQKAVSETVEGMRQIKEKVAGIAENILALSEQTQRIGEITATVNEIAAQSNLLALNASVEAARAGEHGKGFAVVAVEVRNLAEQSKQATSQVKAILNEIQRATNSAVMSTEEGTKGVDAGMALTQETGSTINLLTQSIAESASAAQQIVASSKQQSAGMEQITLAMQNINQATIQSLASTRQTERSAQDLSALAKQLDTLVARYKLN